MLMCMDGCELAMNTLSWLHEHGVLSHGGTGMALSCRCSCSWCCAGMKALWCICSYLRHVVRVEAWRLGASAFTATGSEALYTVCRVCMHAAALLLSSLGVFQQKVRGLDPLGGTSCGPPVLWGPPKPGLIGAGFARWCCWHGWYACAPLPGQGVSRADLGSHAPMCPCWEALLCVQVTCRHRNSLCAVCWPQPMDVYVSLAGCKLCCMTVTVQGKFDRFTFCLLGASQRLQTP